MSTTINIPRSAATPEFCQAVALVGRTVTVRTPGCSLPWQGVVHSVEGSTWYAFDDNGTTVADLNMTLADWITPRAFVIPAGHKLGDGFGVEVPLRVVRPAVCLARADR